MDMELTRHDIAEQYYNALLTALQKIHAGEFGKGTIVDLVWNDETGFFARWSKCLLGDDLVVVSNISEAVFGSDFNAGDIEDEYVGTLTRSQFIEECTQTWDGPIMYQCPYCGGQHEVGSGCFGVDEIDPLGEWYGENK